MQFVPRGFRDLRVPLPNRAVNERLAGRRVFRLLVLAAAALGSSLAHAQGSPERGAYLAKAAGCSGCHTAPASAPYAGGRAIDTPFGTFFGPNITPDPRTGIGKWSEADFRRAIRLGERPDGAHYYP